jgi:hypothetical protein
MLSAINPLKVLAGIALLIGWVVFWQAIKRSLCNELLHRFTHLL